MPAQLAATTTAFQGTGVHKLVFAEGTQTIAANSFSSCRKLESIQFPSTLVQIGTSAFAGSAVKRLSIPTSVATIESRAFASCAGLAEIIFEGNTSAIDMEGAFAADAALATVVFRGTPPHSLQATFPAAGVGCRYFSTIRFFDDAAALAAGTPAAVAAVQHGARLRSVKAGVIPDSQIYDGTVPPLPEGATCWSFDGGAPLSDAVAHSMDAVASDADPSDLSAGYIVTNVSYRYTSSTIDPFAAGSAAGTGFVMTATGEYLTRGVDFTLSYQRKNASGEWAESANKASRGTIRVVATAIPGSGYTGSVAGYYSIADYLPGDTFTADDGNGHMVTYQVLEPGTSETPGKAAVGTGGDSATNYQTAVSDAARGSVALPDVVADPRGNRFEVTEIAPYAFYRCTGVTAVAIPAGVSYVGAKAFAYERIKTDVRTSNIARVDFRNDMTTTFVASDAFLGCDVVSTVVYGQKKGAYEALHPFQLVAGVRLTHYFTARFYPSIDEMHAGQNIVATVVVKEGTYLYSPSYSDYLAGSDRIPFPDETHEWAYDQQAPDEDGRLVDSMDVYGYEVADNTIVVDVPVEAGGVTVDVPCAFTVLAEPSGEGEDTANGRVCVGTMRDGHPCIDAAVTGRLVIPQTVEHLGARYDVVEIGAYAFGSSDETAQVAGISAVTVPASVASIEQAAFMNCASLATVDFAEESQLSTVGAAAFLGCSSLDHIQLPASLTAVRAAAFELSGLRRVVLPAGCQALNRRAFNGCASLREVVFAGPSHLDLPALEGQGDLPPYRYPDAPAQLALASIDDYAFAECPALERVVFESDADELVVSEVAFPDSEKLAAVVFGGAGCDTSSFASGTSAPTTYYTVSFDDAETDAGRLGYVCVPAGTVYSGFDLASAYAGAVPELPLHHEWVPAFDVDEPLTDSASIGLRRIRYAITTDGNDASMLIDVKLADEPVTEAALGDVVTVTVGTQTGVQPTGFTVLDTATGEKLASFETLEGSFQMPGAPVNIRVSYQLDIAIVAQRALFGEAAEECVLTLDEVRDAAAKANPLGEQRRYSAWDVYREPQVIVAGEWIDLRELVAAAGFRFDAGDSLILETADGSRASISYNDLYPELNGANDRYYYPGIARAEQDDAVSALPVIAIRSATYSPADQSEPVQLSLADCYRFCYGQRPRELNNIVNTYSSQAANVVRITVLYGPEDLADCTVQGIPENGYYYTGNPIKPTPTVMDVDGRVLRANVDYQIEYGQNIEAGMGTFTVSGMGLYRGSKDFSFKIRRADTVSGKSKQAIMANTALSAYPEGSRGAVVVASANYSVALSAAALAGALDYPLLITGKNMLSPVAADALAALQYSKDFEIVVVGSKSFVGKKLRKALRRYVPNANYIQTLVGKDRYAISSAIYDYGRDLRLWSSKAIVASGKDFANTVSVLPYAVANRCPILLSNGKKVPKTLTAGAKKKRIKSTLIVGGKKALKSSVVKKVKKLLGASKVKRIKAANRYAACAAVNAFAIKAGMRLDGSVIAAGTNSPSALAGAVLAAKRGAPLMLANAKDVRTLAVLKNGKASVLRISFVGTGSSVPTSVRNQAIGNLGWSKEALK